MKYVLTLSFILTFILRSFGQYHMQIIMKNGISQIIPVVEIDSIIFKNKSIVNEDSVSNSYIYNDLAYNRSKIGDFLAKLKTKTVDQFNQLNIVINGTSTFGRLSLNEIALTPDMNGGSGYGLNTGHFAPNMWQQIFAYKVLKNLQFSNSDVKYFNLSAAEWTKEGFKKYVEIDNTAKWNGDVSFPKLVVKLQLVELSFLNGYFLDIHGPILLIKLKYQLMVEKVGINPQSYRLEVLIGL